jgi:hypothetical protein
VAVALVPLVVSAIALARGVDGFLPVGDLATSELKVRDLGRTSVLTGLYSRADWSHPGPMIWYLLWPFYRLTGSTGLGLALGALAINGASVAGIAAMARRRGGTPLLVCALLGCALLVRSLGGGFTASYWNPYVTTLPFALLVVLVWGMACRDRWALPVAAGVATFLAQTHVGFVPVALCLLAVGAGALVAVTVADGRAADRSAALLRTLVAPAAATAGVLAVLWLPPVIDVLTNEPSNAGRTLAWFRDAAEGVHTLGEGWRVVSAPFGLRGEWLAGQEPGPLGLFAPSPHLAAAPLPLLLVAVAIAAAALWRWRPREGRTLVVTLAVVVIVSVLAVARTVGPIFDYRLRWTWVAPMLAFVAVLWAAWLAVVRRWPGAAGRVVLPGLVAALVVVTGVDAVAAGRVDRLAPGDSDIMAALVPGVLDELDRAGVGPGDEVLIADPPAAQSWFPGGLLVQLDRRGYDARALPERGDQLGDRWVTSGDPDVELVLATDRAALALLDEARWPVVASWSTLPLDDDGLAALRDVFARGDALSEATRRDDVDVDGFYAGLRALEDEVPVEGDMGVRLAVVFRAR